MTFTSRAEKAAILSGDRVRLKELLRTRLVECGWKEEVRLLCRNILKERGTSVTVDQIVDEITPQARALLPDVVKKELLVKIKNTLAEQEGIEL